MRLNFTIFTTAVLTSLAAAAPTAADSESDSGLVYHGDFESLEALSVASGVNDDFAEHNYYKRADRAGETPADMARSQLNALFTHLKGYVTWTGFRYDPFEREGAELGKTAKDLAAFVKAHVPGNKQLLGRAQFLQAMFLDMKYVLELSKIFPPEAGQDEKVLRNLAQLNLSFYLLRDVDGRPDVQVSNYEPLVFSHQRAMEDWAKLFGKSGDANAAIVASFNRQHQRAKDTFAELISYIPQRG